MQVIDVLGLKIHALNICFFLIFIKLVVDLLVNLVGVFAIVTLKSQFVHMPFQENSVPRTQVEV